MLLYLFISLIQNWFYWNLSQNWKDKFSKTDSIITRNTSKKIKLNQ